MTHLREHGKDGLQRECSHYDARHKLCVLRRMWREVRSHVRAAALFDIRDEGSVARWERLYHKGGLDALARRRRDARPLYQSNPNYRGRTRRIRLAVKNCSSTSRTCTRGGRAIRVYVQRGAALRLR